MLADVLAGRPVVLAAPPPTVVPATPAQVAEHRALRRAAFVDDQGLFPRGPAGDLDGVDADERTVVLVAVAPGPGGGLGGGSGTVLGGVRLAPLTHLTGGRDVGWWAGSRLVVHPGAPARSAVAAALVRAACAHAEAAGALRFDAVVQPHHAAMFARLGWEHVEPVVLGPPDGLVREAAHVLMAWPVTRVERLVAATKAPLGVLLAPLAGAAGVRGAAVAALGGAGFVGDDGAPVPGSDLVAACDAILPSMVERDPWWAGWCSVLVNLGDLAAMGAEPVGLLDALGARDASFATRVLRGLRDASAAWGVPVLGGHTQLGVPASLAVTALGRTDRPVPAGGGRPGHDLTLTADLGGAWRTHHRGAQWDSTTRRDREELKTMGSTVGRTRPPAAKDVSMAGVVGTAGMLAEASGCAAVLDVAAVPAPPGTTTGDWLTCFPGFGMLTADVPGRPVAPAGPATSQGCGHLTSGEGVTLRWPDGRSTVALAGATTGMGTA